MTIDKVEESMDINQLSDKAKNFITTRNAKDSVILGDIRHHEPVILPFCEGYDLINEDLEKSCKNNKCIDCTVSFDNLIMHKKHYYIGIINLIIWASKK